MKSEPMIVSCCFLLLTFQITECYYDYFCDDNYNFQYDDVSCTDTQYLKDTETDENNSLNNSNRTNNTSSPDGNSLYLVLDPKSKLISVQVTIPCNKTSNSSNSTDGAQAANNPGSSGGNLLPNYASSTPLNINGDGKQNGNPEPGLLCTLQSIVNALLNQILLFLNSLLQSLIHSIIALLSQLLDTTLSKNLPNLLEAIIRLLNETVNNILLHVENLVNEIVNDLLNQSGLVDKLLNNVGSLLSDALGDSTNEAGLQNITTSVGAVVNETIQTVLQDVRKLTNVLLNPNTSALLPTLTTDVNALVNNTLEDVLKDVDKLASDLLNNLLTNSSLVQNLTTDINILLQQLLQGTICDVEQLLSDPIAFHKLITNLEKLITDLLKNVLQTIEKLLIDVLQTALNKNGLLADLLSDINKLLKDVLKNLLLGSLLGGNPTDRTEMKKDLFTTLIQNVTQLLQNVTSDDTGFRLVRQLPDRSPNTNNITRTALVGQIVGLVNETLTEILTSIDKLLENIEKTVLDESPLAKLTSGIISLVEGLLNDILTVVKQLLGNNLTETLTKQLQANDLTGNLTEVVTNILKQVLLCNSSCSSTTSAATDSHAVTNPTPISNITNGTFATSTTCSPLCDLLEDQFLFDNPQSSLYNLQQQCKSFISNTRTENRNCDEESDLFDTMYNSYPIPSVFNNDGYSQSNNFGFECLGEEVLEGVDETLQATNDAATNGLINLVSKIVKNTNRSSDLIT